MIHVTRPFLHWNELWRDLYLVTRNIIYNCSFQEMKRESIFIIYWKSLVGFARKFR